MDGFVDWPSDFARAYRSAGYWTGITIGDAFVDSVERHRERIAIVEGQGHEGTRTVRYGELGVLVERLAGHLTARAIGAGDTIVFQLPNTLEFVVAYFACLRVGAIPICALPHHRHSEIGPLAALAGARAWFGPSTHRGFDYLAMIDALRPSLPSLREIWAIGDRGGSMTASFAELLTSDAPSTPRSRPSSSDVAVLQLSGGTTGVPKLIPRTHDDYLYNSLAFAKATSLGKDDVLLLPIPIAHNFPLACPGLQGALLLGARVVLAPSPAADAVFPLVQSERATWVPCVPATLIQWTEHPRRGEFDLTSLRRIYVGGQRLNPQPALAAIDAFGPVVRQVYGMAEGLLCCTTDEDLPEAHVETQGRPMSDGDELRVVDDEGRVVPDGTIGELEVRGPYTIRGYYRARDHNAEAFTSDGYYRTGDMVRRTPSGHVVVEGRRKDLINRGGEKISAEEIEGLLLAHPSVANVAVVAMDDPVLGERACACVVLAPETSVTLPELVAFLRTKNIATFKLPERLEILDRLPLTGVGKVSKKELRQLVASSIRPPRSTEATER